MLKKIIIISTFILLLFWINFSSLKSYYYNKTWEKYFMQNDLKTALKYFSLANNDFWKYNEWNIFYANKDFSWAISNYESILDTKKSDLLFNTSHNLWNSYYRIWEKLEWDNQKKYYEKSVNYYSWALNIKEDSETRANLEFVLNKLKEQEKKDDKSDEKSSSGSQDNSSWSGSQNSSWSGSQNSSIGSWSQNNENSWQDNSSTWSGSQDNSTWSWSQSNSWSWTQNASSENAWDNSKSWASAEALSSEQLKAISDYKEALKKEQDYNSEWFNKVYQGDWNWDIFDNFFNNSLLNQDEKKDW